MGIFAIGIEQPIDVGTRFLQSMKKALLHRRSWARDRAPSWQRDTPRHWWLIGTGGRLRILSSLQDSFSGSLEGSYVVFRTWTRNIRRYP